MKQHERCIGEQVIMCKFKNSFSALCKLNLFSLVGIVLWSFVISYIILNPLVIDWVSSRVPPYVFNLEVLDEANEASVSHEVWINSLAIGDNEDMESLFQSCQNSGFEFRAAEAYGYNNDVITKTGADNSYITLTWLNSNSFSCEFWKQNLSGIVKVCVKQGDKVLDEQVIDLYSSEGDSFITYAPNIPEYEMPYKYTVLRWSIVGLGTAIIFLLIIMLLSRFLKEQKKDDENVDIIRDESAGFSADQQVAADNKRIEFKICMVLLIFAVLITCTLSTYIDDVSNNIVKSVMPTKTVTVTIAGTDNAQNGDIWLIDEYWLAEEPNENNLFSYCLSGVKEGVWELRKAEDWSYSNNTLLSYGENAGSTITFSAPAIPGAYLMFWAHGGCGKIMVEVDGVVQELNTNSDISSNPRIFPFRDSYLPVILHLIFFVLFGMVVFSALLTIYWLCYIKQIRIARLRFLFLPYHKYSFFTLWILLYFFAVIQYKAGIPSYFNGDQGYYWGEALIGMQAWWNPQVLADSLASFRGYLCNVPTMIAQVLGNKIYVDPIYVYLYFTAFAVAWLVGYVFPEMYSICSKKQAKTLNVLLLLAIYLFFWNGTLTAVLVDLFGCTAFLTGLLFGIKLLKIGLIRYGIVCGASWAVACNLRTAYQYGIYVIVVYLLYLLIYKTIKKNKCVKCNIQIKVAEKRLCIFGLLAVALSFFMISLPQYQINMVRGHNGILPYDSDGSWMVISEGITWATTLTESSANTTLMSSYTGYPLPISDDQMLSIKEPEYIRQDVLNTAQILGVYANNFMDTLVYLFKKVFIAFDIKTNASYPKEEIGWRDSSGMLFSLINYIVLASSLLIVIKDKKKISSLERIIVLLLFGGLAVPQMFVHVEWRYFLVMTVMLYYFFSYYFVDYIRDNIRNKQTTILYKYLKYICIVVYIAFTISFTICA